jgi:hypothetical protein
MKKKTQNKAKKEQNKMIKKWLKNRIKKNIFIYWKNS